jgi:UPF0716 family protein affecting phage T7 exclusion
MAIMKKRLPIYIITFLLFLSLPVTGLAQCSICTKTAQQMGEKPGKALNAGIIYLAAAPLIILGFIGYRWYKSNRGQ